MNTDQLLELLEANRDLLVQNSAKGIEEFSELRRNNDQPQDEELDLSMALSEAIVAMAQHADYATAISISTEAQRRYPASVHSSLIARHHGLIGRSLAMSGRYTEALRHLHISYSIATHIAGRTLVVTTQIADTLHDLAMANDMARGPVSESTAWLTEAIALLEDTTLDIRRGICYMGLGNIQVGADNIEAALPYYMQAEEIFDKNSNLNNLAAVHSNIGLCYMNLNNDLASKYLMSALDMRIRMGNQDDIINSYYNLSEYYEGSGNVAEAYRIMLASRDNVSYEPSRPVYRQALALLAKLSTLNNDTANASLYAAELAAAEQYIPAEQVT